MPRRLFKRLMPNPDRLREHKSLRFLARWLNLPNLWHLNRHSVARAMGVGLFSAFVPIPLQMALAAALAVLVRGNLPIAVSLVWITNPLTLPAFVYGTYKLGAWLLQVPPRHLPEHVSWEWVSREMATLWQPLVLGSLVTGILVGALGYGVTMLYWRWWVVRQWRRRTRQH